MSQDPDPSTEPSTEPRRSPVYQVRLQGHLGRRWAEWFEGLTITLEEDGETVLSGPVADQAELHGLLKRVRDVGMSIVSVIRVEPKPAAALDPNADTPHRPPTPEVSD